MRKYLYLVSARLVMLFTTSCDNNNAPTDPSQGGTFLVSEVYNLFGMEEQKAIDRLEAKGFEYDGYEYDDDKNVHHFFIYQNNKVNYNVTLIFEDEVVVKVFGSSNQDVTEYKNWSNWLSKQMSYELWLGMCDDYIYIDGKSSNDYYFTKSKFDNGYTHFQSYISEYYYNKTKDFTFYIYAEYGGLVCGGMRGGREILSPYYK